MLYSRNRFACSDAVRIVGIGIAVKGLELSAFFPSQSVTEIRDRIALRVIGNGYNIIIPDDIGKINGLYKIFWRIIIKTPHLK